MSTPLNITIIDNGPLKVSGDAKTVHYCGEALALEGDKDLYLCRCGESSNPPYCDGSHSKTGFKSEPAQAEKKPVHVWEGQTIKTFFNPNACMHVFYCKPLKELRARELEGDAEAATEIARVVQSCPSGALSCESKTVAAPAAAGPMIDIMEGGELRVQGAFEINDDLQERQDSSRATLCRCGLSKNKPWCDGRHKKRPDFR